ncbi:MAG: CbiQ family ECF transporter T component [Desulfobacterales bacterium]|nr:CbiQ family ECF transporter T component [Desulfobacterales bacterium]
MPPLFEYMPGKTTLHALDPRCKFFLICLVGTGIIFAGWTACLFGLLILVLLLSRAGIRLASLIGQLKLFLLLLGFIIIARAFTTPGTPIIKIWDAVITWQGLGQGGLVALRFLLVMLLGLTLTATTRPAAIKAAVQWALAPLPLVPEKRVGTMISLALRFFPMILTQATETQQAMDARCGHLRKNPLKRISTLTLSLLGKTFRSANAMAMAMDARCYDDNRTDPEFSSSGKEPFAITAGLACFLLFFCF